jgi:acyl carrier protein
METLAQSFRQFITENFLFGRDHQPLGDDDSLLEAGIIDSTGVLELIRFIETNYGVAFEDVDLVPENLDSINALVRFVEMRQAHAGAVLS